MSKNFAWSKKSAIAVLGGSLSYTPSQVRAAFRVGFELAQREKIVITGATTGVPYAAALGAHAAGGFVIGVSPAEDRKSHIESGRPAAQADFILYSGMGAEGRGPLILRSARAGIFIGGEFGTLAEFCCGWLTGTEVLGVLEGIGGFSESIRALASGNPSSWGSKVIFAEDPISLTEEVCEALEELPDLDQDLGADVRAAIARDYEGEAL